MREAWVKKRDIKKKRDREKYENNVSSGREREGLKQMKVREKPINNKRWKDRLNM